MNYLDLTKLEEENKILKKTKRPNLSRKIKNNPIKIKKVTFAEKDNEEELTKFDNDSVTKEVQNKINEIKGIKKNLQKSFNPESKFNEDENNDSSTNTNTQSANKKFSLLSFVLKLILFFLFLIVIYVAYLYIFKKHVFIEKLQQIKDIKNPLRTSTEIMNPVITNPVISSSQGSGVGVNSVTSSTLTPEMDIKYIEPTFKGGQSYINEKNLVKDIISILDQFK